MNLGFSLADTADTKATGLGATTLVVLSGLVTLVAVAVGIYGFFIHHEFYNVTIEVPWGLLIAAYAFFAITSTGLCLLAAISHTFDGNNIAPLSKRMVWMSLMILISGFLVIGMEIINPWRMAIWNIISPNPTSNIWWMGTLYGAALGFIIVELWLIFTKRYSLALALGIMGALAEVAANSCLGGVFATLASHPFWYGAIIPVYFLICAFTSGAAATIIMTYFAAVLRGEKLTETQFKGIRAAGKVLVFMIIAVAVATFWRMITFYVGGTPGARAAAESLINGPLKTNFLIFELAIGLAAPLFILLVTRLKSPISMALAAIMVLVGMFVARLDMVVAGQIVPKLYGFEDFPTYFPYTPSTAEWIVTSGGLGLTMVAFLLGERFFGKVFEDQEAH